MQLDFFPSKTLTLYLARTFVVRIAAVLVMLVLVLQALDLLSQSSKVLAYEGNGQGELLRYIGYRMPQLVARFLPYSVLLATIITLATFNQNSEVVAMKAAGLSAHQILAPLLLAALAVSVISFAFNERIVTRSSAALSAWQAEDYGPVAPDSDVRTNVYLRDGDNILSARVLAGTGEDIRMRGVQWYRRDAEGRVTEKISAPAATYANPGWLLDDPVRFDVAAAQEIPIDPVRIAKGVSPRQAELGRIDPDALSLTDLGGAIGELSDAGRRTAELESKWWHKLSGPLSAFLMPLLGAIAAFGLARSGQLFVRAIIGMMLGFAYFVVDNAALAMGNFGGYPPFLAAWAPFLLFFLVGETVLIRTEE